MNKDQLQEAIRLLKKKEITVTKIAGQMGISQPYLSRVTNAANVPDKFSRNFHKEFGKFLPPTLFDDEIIIKTDAGNIMERLIGLEAWANVLEAQLISWASKMGDEPGALMMRLKQAKDREMERLANELRRKKK